MSVSPGPNNLMVLASSVNFGATRTLGHIFGASIGSAILIFLVGLGLHNLFYSFPLTQSIMKYCGAVYILFLSWRMFRGTNNISEENTSQPMGFFHATLFQWINPKSWIMAGAAISSCLPSPFSLIDITLYAILFIIISFPCVGVWAWSGVVIKKYIRSEKTVGRFNRICAGLLALSSASMILI